MENQLLVSFGEQQMLYCWFAAMHSRLDFVLLDKGLTQARCDDTVAQMRRRIAEIEVCGNCFDPASELSVANASAPATLSPLLNDILSQCVYYNKVTEGLFDVTMPRGGGFQVKDGQLSLSEKSVHIDLSGFLKGYALDALRSILRENGIENALLSFGSSSIMALGHDRNGRAWRVAVPQSKEVVDLSDECLTTSGNATADRRHIVNPLTGEYVEGCRQVSVVTPNATLGEVLSTCFFIADKKKRLHLTSLFHIDHYFSE